MLLKTQDPESLKNKQQSPFIPKFLGTACSGPPKGPKVTEYRGPGAGQHSHSAAPHTESGGQGGGMRARFGLALGAQLLGSSITGVRGPRG